MEIYLIYDMADGPKMTIQEKYDARQRFVQHALSTGKLYTYDLLGYEDGHLYRAGEVFDYTDLTYPPTIAIPRELGLDIFGSCIDLAKMPPEDVSREFLFIPS